MTELSYSFGGCTYVLRIDYPAYLSDQSLSSEGRSYVEGVIERVPIALDFAAAKLLMLYNGAWLDDVHKEIDAAQFKSALKLETLEILDEPDNATLYFMDGDMFGGHWVEVMLAKFEPVYAGLIG